MVTSPRSLRPALTTPIARQPVAELVISRIMELIRSGALKPGDKLPPERELAQLFDISRPSVRESLRALSIMGVLQIRHGGGVYVSTLETADFLTPLDFFISLDAGNLMTLFEARIHFEPMMAKLAAARIDTATLARLRAEVDLQRAAPDDIEVFHNSDIEFHRLITEASGNAVLARIGKIIQLLGERARHMLVGVASTRRQSVEDHVLILGALERRDPAAAAQAMEAHFSNVRRALDAQVGG